MFYGNISLRDYDLQITAFCFYVYIYICLFSSVFYKAAKITNELDSNLKNNILILQNIGRYINNASPKKTHIKNVLKGQKL